MSEKDSILTDVSFTEQREVRRQHRKQKNIRIGEWYADTLLPKLSRRAYGTDNKHGQVIEEALDVYLDKINSDEGSDGVDSSTKRMVAEIHAEVCGSKSAHTHTRSRSSSSSNQTGDSVVDELVEMAEAGEPIDPDEYDLSEIKGVRGVPREQIVKSVLDHKYGDRGYATHDEIKAVYLYDIGYSDNGARQHINKLEYALTESPLVGISSWVKEQVESEIDDRWNGGKYVHMRTSKYRSKYAGGLADYLQKDKLPDEWVYEGYYLDDVSLYDVAPSYYRYLSSLRIQRSDSPMAVSRIDTLARHFDDNGLPVPDDTEVFWRE